MEDMKLMGNLQSMNSETSPNLAIPSLTYSQLRLLLCYIYGSTQSIFGDNVGELLVLANKVSEILLKLSTNAHPAFD